MIAFGHRRANTISPAMVLLSDNVDPVTLKSAVTKVFKDCFQPSPCVHLMDWGTRFPTLSDGEATALEAPFFEEEIFQCLMKVYGSKSPGPDVFSFKFAQPFWGVFKGDLFGLFHYFYENVEFDHRFSESFISLIPKVRGPSPLNNFRLISLRGWVHKLVARVLTSRLCSIIDHLVSHT